MFNKFRFSIQHLWALTVISGVFIFVSTHPIRPQDFWWHMAVGQEIIDTGSIPAVDNYSYTMKGASYPSYQAFWLMDLALYFVYRLGGGEMVIFVHSLVITAAYTLVLWLGYLIAGNWRIAAFTTLYAAALGLNDWNVRPQAITFLLGALVLFALQRYRTSHQKRWLGVLPVCMALWVNSHGTYLIGLGVIGIWWLEEVWSAYRRHDQGIGYFVSPTISGLLALLACLLNPAGLGILKYIGNLTGNEVIKNFVPEWAPPTFNNLAGSIFLIALIISACILALSPKRPTLSQLSSFVIFSLLGLRTMRGSIWYGLVIAPVLADHLSAIVHDKVSEKKVKNNIGLPWLNQVFMIGILILIVVSLPWFKQYLPLPQQKAGIFSMETPIQATDFLINEQLPGPIFHAMSFGSYLIWEAQPEYPVFVDSRIELFDIKIWREYLIVSNGSSGWQGILDAYGIQTIMASPNEQEGLIYSLAESMDWKKVYSDRSAIIYTQSDN